MIKVLQPAQIETKTRGDIMAVKIPADLCDDKDLFFFLDLQQVKEFKLESLDLKTLLGKGEGKDLWRYFYYRDDINILSKKLDDGGNGTRLFFEEINNLAQQNTLELLEAEDFNSHNLVYYWSYGHMLYRFRDKMPVSRPYYIDYIKGVTNRHYDLDKAESILEKNKCVTGLKREKIPYYNSEPGYTEALEFTVLLSQEKHDELVDYYRDKLNDVFWTISLKDCLSEYYRLDPFDVLGLKPARVS